MSEKPLLKPTVRLRGFDIVLRNRLGVDLLILDANAADELANDLRAAARSMREVERIADKLKELGQ